MPGGTIRQVHGDGHLGLERARKEKFPASRRVLDYAHLIGSTSSPATIPAHDDADRSITVCQRGYWRAVFRFFSFWPGALREWVRSEMGRVSQVWIVVKNLGKNFCDNAAYWSAHASSTWLDRG